MNIQKIMKQAQEMQKKLSDAQEKIAHSNYEGSAGGGLVKITLTGKTDITTLSLDDSLIVPSDKEMLIDLIIAAFNDAKRKAENDSATIMEQAASGLPLPPGMKLPF